MNSFVLYNYLYRPYAVWGKLLESTDMHCALIEFRDFLWHKLSVAS